jgi:hypothetical protein
VPGRNPLCRPGPEDYIALVRTLREVADLIEADDRQVDSWENSFPVEPRATPQIYRLAVSIWVPRAPAPFPVEPAPAEPGRLLSDQQREAVLKRLRHSAVEITALLARLGVSE